MEPSTSNSLSFLDMLCGGVGALFMLMLLMSIVGASPPPPGVGESAVVEFTTYQDSFPGDHRFQLGVLVEDSQQHVVAVHKLSEGEPNEILGCEVSCASGTKKIGEKWESFIRISLSATRSGRWVFRPYIVSMQNYDVPTKGAAFSGTVWIGGQEVKYGLTGGASRFEGSSADKEVVVLVP
jgi:hypothetical protein